ncbi:hypothetical protein [Nakamurella endophytica]|uniref:Lipoprotein n=1 Tax=Nakamurella endophytica TaxID=1748367 RepID=A0A917WIV7_9ACTN|nr:hypothetical protein [Nakamurella endophytica]GGM07514.1 hypothetical protein GCM10011594_29340 [Nakamurella endophytica]
MSPLRTFRTLTRSALAGAAVVLLAACQTSGTASPATTGPTSSTTSTGTTSTGTTSTGATDTGSCPAVRQPATAPPTPAGPPLLVVTHGANYWVASPQTEPYRIALWPDGTVIVTDDAGERTRPPARFRIGTVGDCATAAVVRQIRELSRQDMGTPSITDQGTTHVALGSGQGAVTIDVYGFGVGDEYVSPVQRGHRADLRRLLDGLAAAVTGAPRWTPDRVRVVESSGPRTDTPVTWPSGVDLDGALRHRAPGGRCGVLTGRAATAVLDRLGSGPVQSVWRVGVLTKVLLVAPLVPGQPDCPRI